MNKVTDVLKDHTYKQKLPLKWFCFVSVLKSGNLPMNLHGSFNLNLNSLTLKTEIKMKAEKNRI